MSNDNPDTVYPTGRPSAVDDTIAALADEQHRRIVRYFEEHRTDVASLDDIVASLTEDGTPPDAGDRLAVELHHVTLPKLAGVGAVEYDARSHTVRYQPDRRFELVSALLADLAVVE